MRSTTARYEPVSSRLAGAAPTLPKKQATPADARPTAQREEDVPRTSVTAPALPRVPGVIIGKNAYTGYDQPMLVFGATGAGKTTWLLRNIIQSPGAAVISSMKPEVFAYTAGYFAARGRPVYVLDVDGSLTLPPEMKLRWSPITSCLMASLPPNLPPTAQVVPSRFGGYVSISQAEKIGERLSYAAIPAAGGDEGGWRGQTANLVTALITAAAVGGVTDPQTMLLWAGSAAACQTPLDILRSAGLLVMRNSLNSAIGPGNINGGANRSSFANLVSKALSSFKNPYIAQMCQVGPSDSLDVADFLARRGVVYLVGSSESQAVVASIIATFVEDLIEKARMIEKPISPPMCLWLDEVANIVPLPKLPQLYSTGRGDGIYLASVLQSYSQAEQTWGREGADTMHANAVVEVHLSGSKDTAMLSWLSQAGGQRDTTSRSRSYSRDGHSDTVSQGKEQRFDTRSLRALQPRHAWVVYQNRPPVESYLAPWWESNEADAISFALKEAERWVPEPLLPRPAPEQGGLRALLRRRS